MKFSIIVPVYNVKNYLQQCLDSIKNQKFNDYEVILVDDGSTDGSGELCEKYAQDSPSNWTVLHQKNGGQSFARNQGIKLAKGEYIVLVDSDDFLHTSEDLLDLKESINKNALNGKPDVILSTSYAYYEDLNSIKLRDWNEKRVNLTGTQAMESIFKCPTFIIGPWIITVSRKLFLAKQLWFMNGIYHEDEFWVPQVLCSTNSVIVNQRPFYCNRCDRKGSTTSVANIKKIYDKIFVLDTIESKIPELDNEHKIILNFRCSQLMVGIMKDSLKYNSSKVYSDIKKRLWILKKSKERKYHNLYLLCRIIGVRNCARILNHY